MVFRGQHKYRPLSRHEIRLLHLHPGERQTSIHIRLTQARLEDRPTYEALSYVWGSSTEKTPILCDEVGNVLDVTNNCEAALRTLRTKDTVRTLWVDAICINQDDVEERNQQIQLMPDIYSGADRVVAFLGNESEDSNLGMDFILDDSDSILQDNRPAIGPLQRTAIDGILERTYFQRAWIIQEILLAKEVQIVLGDKAVDWGEFSRSVFYVDAHKKLVRPGQHNSLIPAVVFWRDRMAVDKPNTLLQYLDQTRYCKS
jgi:hypothetical protein